MKAHAALPAFFIALLLAPAFQAQPSAQRGSRKPPRPKPPVSTDAPDTIGDTLVDVGLDLKEIDDPKQIQQLALLVKNAQGWTEEKALQQADLTEKQAKALRDKQAAWKQQAQSLRMDLTFARQCLEDLQTATAIRDNESRAKALTDIGDRWDRLPTMTAGALGIAEERMPTDKYGYASHGGIQAILEAPDLRTMNDRGNWRRTFLMALKKSQYMGEPATLPQEVSTITSVPARDLFKVRTRRARQIAVLDQLEAAITATVVAPNEAYLAARAFITECSVKGDFKALEAAARSVAARQEELAREARGKWDSEPRRWLRIDLAERLPGQLAWDGQELKIEVREIGQTPGGPRGSRKPKETWPVYVIRIETPRTWFEAFPVYPLEHSPEILPIAKSVRSGYGGYIPSPQGGFHVGSSFFLSNSRVDAALPVGECRARGMLNDEYVVDTTLKAEVATEDTSFLPSFAIRELAELDTAVGLVVHRVGPGAARVDMAEILATLLCAM